MKYIIVLGDGMADEPIKELGGKTPLQVAETPAMDMLARKGRCGLIKTVPDGMHPGSEVANMAVLGYDVAHIFEGRGVLEAASMGIDIPSGYMAMRCNLINITDGKIKNHSAGHISTEEATELIGFLNKELSNEIVKFYPGVSYRHLLLIKGGDKRISCTPPHDVPGEIASNVMIKADCQEAAATAELINEIIIKSQKILETHPINQKRRKDGKDTANSIWPWSPGYRPAMLPLSEKYPIKNGAVISAVDLIFGIGVYAGLKAINVEGATGLYDTNYEGKAQAAIDALRGDTDFVFLHVEASDEAGHEGDAELKKRTIEYLDHRIIAPIIEAAQSFSESLTIAVLPDHPTPCRLKTHTSNPVPFLIYKPGAEADTVESFSEETAAKGSYGLIDASHFMGLLFSQNDNKL